MKLLLSDNDCGGRWIDVLRRRSFSIPLPAATLKWCKFTLMLELQGFHKTNREEVGGTHAA